MKMTAVLSDRTVGVMGSGTETLDDVARFLEQHLRACD